MFIFQAEEAEKQQDHLWLQLGSTSGNYSLGSQSACLINVSKGNDKALFK